MKELRTRTLGCLLLLGISPDLYAEIANSERSSDPSLALIVDFEGACSPVSFHAMQAELATILQPLGVTADWHFLKQVTGSQTFTELVVVRFKGSCDVDQQTRGGFVPAPRPNPHNGRRHSAVCGNSVWPYLRGDSS
jgi:hypothetical protein